MMLKGRYISSLLIAVLVGNGLSSLIPVTSQTLEQANPSIQAQLNLSQPLEGTTRRSSRLPLGHWQRLPRGAYNDLTDIKGVRVNHLTWQTNGPQPIQTGLTAISLTGPDQLGSTSFWAQASTLHGNGEVTGLHYLNQSGWLNGPILLTNTRSVGRVWEGVMSWMSQRFSDTWESWLPIVGECWDGDYNTLTTTPIEPKHVATLLAVTDAEPLIQGRVGAGTGMRSFGLRAGIGSASRQVTWGKTNVHIGVLVNTNHSSLKQLAPPFIDVLEQTLDQPLQQIQQQDERQKINLAHAGQASRQGSIVVIVVTDAPIGPLTLKALSERATEGIAIVGGLRAPSSGDFAIAVTTANPIHHSSKKQANAISWPVVPDTVLLQLYQGVVEAVVEAQLNAIVSAHQRQLDK